jgi:hypothetical protein
MKNTFKPRIALYALLLSLGILILIAKMTYGVVDNASGSSLAKSMFNNGNEESWLDTKFVMENLWENVIPLCLSILFGRSLIMLARRRIVFDENCIIISGYKVDFDNIACFHEDILSTKNDKDFKLHLESYSGEDRFDIEETLKPFSLKK